MAEKEFDMHELLTNQYLAQSSTDVGGGLLGGIGGIVVGLVLYALFTFPMYKIAERCGAENPWFQFVPLLNVYGLVVEMAQLDWWWILLCLIPFVNIFVIIYIYCKVAENAGFPTWTGILMIVPVVNLLLLYYWAFGPQTALRG